MNFFRKLSVIAVPLFFLSVIAQAQARKAVADKIIAVVGDKIILQSEITNSVNDYQREEHTVPANARCIFTQQALLSKVLMLQAEKDSVRVSEEEIDAELDMRFRFWEKKFGGKEAIADISGKSIFQLRTELREAVREKMLAEAMQRKIIKNVKITPAEVKAFFDRIPIDSLPLYESELEIGQIISYPAASGDMEKYVINEMLHYKKQVESKLTSFSQLASKVSEDKNSAERGGLYDINRNDESWDNAIRAAVFRLKEGEVSVPVRSKQGFYLIQLQEKSGDDAIVRVIVRIPTVTETEIKNGIARLDTVRAKIIAGTISFNEAAKKYSEDKASKYDGPFILNYDRAPRVTIDQLDREMVAVLKNMQAGDLSQPVTFTGEEGRKGVRIVYLRWRSTPHRMNLADDYSKIAQLAMEEKKSVTLEKWMKSIIQTCYITIDEETTADCPQVQPFASNDKKGF